MSYIGNSITEQSFTGGVDQFNGNASNTAFGLSRQINTVYDVDVYVENVWQRPTTGYTVSANTITFTSAPSSGSNNVVVVYRSFSATSVIPQQGSVTTTSFAANAIPATLGYTPVNKAGDTFTGAVSGITTLGTGNTTITGTANVSQGLTSNTLTVSTNTATIGTSLYSVANGFVGISSSSPQSPLEVTGLIRTTGFVANPSSGAGMEMAWDGTQGVIQAYSNRASQTTAPVYFTGGQIKFPATQNASSDANTLDDYEEGTWTPNCIHVSSNNSTWGSKSGYYVKIGGIVHCWWLCDSGNSGTAGSELYVTGLPFATSASNIGYGTCGIWGTNGTTLTGNHFIQAGQSYVKLFRGGQSYSEQQTFASGYITYKAT